MGLSFAWSCRHHSPMVIAGPTVIGPCASLPLDLSGSTGGAGRDWAAASFAVTVSSGPDNAANLTEYLRRDIRAAWREAPRPR